MIIRPIEAEARRILVDASQVYGVYRDTRDALREYRGGMKWIRRRGREYLFRQTSPRGDGKSLGPRSEKTERVLARFREERSQLTERRKSLLAEVRRQSKFCVAGELNRVPRIAADVIRALDEAGALDALTVVGTTALYAYENLVGVQFDRGMLTTPGIDLMWDAGRRLELIGPRTGEGLLGVLRKADSSFRRDGKAKCRAVNSRGFAVDLIRPRERVGASSGPVAPSGKAGDLVAAEVSRPDWLRSFPRIRATVFGSNGHPALIKAPDPRAFAAQGLWLSGRRTRRIKGERDRRQGMAVLQLVREYLPSLPLDAEGLAPLPSVAREVLTEALAALPCADADPVAGLGPELASSQGASQSKVREEETR